MLRDGEDGNRMRAGERIRDWEGRWMERQVCVAVRELTELMDERELVSAVKKSDISALDTCSEICWSR
jgi:hypothetical protein